MKKILLAALVAVPFFCSSQTFSTKSDETGSIDSHIEVAILMPAMSKRFQVWYLGDGTRYSIVTGEDSKPYKFTSYSQIFNFLETSGYRMVTQIPTPPVMEANAPLVTYLFRKE